MALSGRRWVADQCPLSGVKLTSQIHGAVSANDAVDGSSPRHVSAMGHSGIWSFPNIRTTAALYAEATLIRVYVGLWRGFQVAPCERDQLFAIRSA